MERSFIVALARFHREDPNIYMVQGYFQGNTIAGNRMRAFADDRELDLQIGVREGLAIRQKYFSRGMVFEDIDREYDLMITLPAENFRKLRVFQYLDGERKCVYAVSASRLKEEKKLTDGYLETWREDEQTVSVGGWAVGNGNCRIQVFDHKGQRLESSVTHHYRQDILDNYPEIKQKMEKDAPSDNKANAPAGQRDLSDISFGFDVTFARPKSGNRVNMVIASNGTKRVFRLNLSRGEKNIRGSKAAMFTKISAYFRRYGFARTIQRVFEKLKEKTSGQKESYMSWRERHMPTKEQLQAQRQNVFLKQPLISIVVPMYQTPENYLKALVNSVIAQTYKNWELVLSDGSRAPSQMDGLLSEIKAMDRRIKVVHNGRKLGISENTNEALAAASGDYIVFADHDDLLPEHALYELVKKVNEEPDVDLIYSDEDKVSMDGKKFFEPHFKSDYNPDLLCSMNYFCHLVMVSRDLQEKVGLLDPRFDGAQDYDFVLRACEQAQKICHIPQVLYHWRSHQNSTAENPESKRYAFEAGKRAIQAHYDRVGVRAEVSMGQYPGLYRTDYLMPEILPMISIIIPNKDHIDDLDKCVRSIMKTSSYKNYEFIVVENNSTEERTFEYYRSMEQQYLNFHVAYWDKAFNYAAINNFGVQQAQGEYLLFLNNDTELINADCFQQLLGPLLREEVGITGARLYYPDETIQHAGVIIGYGGIAGHAFQYFPKAANGYFSRIICQSDLSAVTAACLMTRKSVFDKVGGFDENLVVAFNDIDFCLKVREQNLLVVYNPFAQLWHYESKSRGMEDTPEKIARFNKEADILISRWADILKNGDPYYNPNLSLDANDFSLKP